MPNRPAANVFSNSLFTDTAILYTMEPGFYNNDGEWVPPGFDTDSGNRIVVIAEPIGDETEDGEIVNKILVGGMRFFVKPTTDVSVLQTGDDVEPNFDGAAGDIIEFAGVRYRAYKKMFWYVYQEVQAYRLGQQNVIT